MEEKKNRHQWRKKWNEILIIHTQHSKVEREREPMEWFKCTHGISVKWKVENSERRDEREREKERDKNENDVSTSSLPLFRQSTFIFYTFDTEFVVISLESIVKLSLSKWISDFSFSF